MSDNEICYFSIIDQMEVKSYHLKEIAEGLVREFKEQHVAGNKRKEKQSYLFCKCRGRHEAYYLDWHYNYWVGGMRGERRQKYITKPQKQYAYTLSKLLKHSAPWEHETVQRTEQMFTLLRMQAKAIVQARSHLYKAMEAAHQLELMREQWSEE